VLRDAVISCIQYVPRQAHIVARVVESDHQLTKKFLVFSNGQSFDVLEYEGARVKLGDYANELKDQAVPCVLQSSMSY
jgi:hypothetical protein